MRTGKGALILMLLAALAMLLVSCGGDGDNIMTDTFEIATSDSTQSVKTIKVVLE